MLECFTFSVYKSRTLTLTNCVVYQKPQIDVRACKQVVITIPIMSISMDKWANLYLAKFFSDVLDWDSDIMCFGTAIR